MSFSVWIFVTQTQTKGFVAEGVRNQYVGSEATTFNSGAPIGLFVGKDKKVKAWGDYKKDEVFMLLLLVLLYLLLLFLSDIFLFLIFFFFCGCCA